MSKKDSNFFEEHVEKIVLVIAGLVFLWLFVTRVLFSPICIEYDNDKFAPGTIDNYISSKQAGVLESKVNRKPEPKQPYEPRVDDYNALFDSAISNINISLDLPQPIISARGEADDRVYRIPLIGEIKEVLAEHIRTVAYVPNREINEENTYGIDNSEPNDIDFVTVEAKFDVSELYKRFNESFAGEHVRQDWRDQRFAKPVFAAVQLQRQGLLLDGSWSDWQTVPRSRVDRNRRMFEIIENLDDLPSGGVKVRLLQFDNPMMRMDLLQPETYSIASANEEWFPPSLHKKYVEYQKEMDIARRREAVAERREGREGERSERRSRTARAETRPTGGIDMEAMWGPSTSASRRTTSRGSQSDRDRRSERERSVSRTLNDVYQEFDEILLADDMDISRMDKPLLFWAYDDTVEPDNSYRYRIRLGVFNPIAGTDQFSERDESLKNKVILWSQFSDVTETVDVPGTLYFFPRDIQEATEVVTVQVSRYVLGYWYSKDFTVKHGELIGRVGEYKITEEEEKARVTVPKMVDYVTGAVVVDIVPVNDWSGGNYLSARHFFDMLYSFDGRDIERLPIKTRYWPEELQNKFNEIRRSERESKEPLRGWAAGRLGKRRPGGIQIGEEEVMPESRSPETRFRY